MKASSREKPGELLAKNSFEKESQGGSDDEGEDSGQKALPEGRLRQCLDHEGKILLGNHFRGEGLPTP